MNQAPTPLNRCRQVFSAFRKHYLVWLVPTTIAMACGVFYAIFLHQPKWEASQSVFVRDEAMASLSGVGRFDSNDQRKTAQETIQEIAIKTAVLEAALKEAGPESAWSSKAYPTPSDVKELRQSLSIVAPNGTEFGKTELIHLQVRAKSKERAIALTLAAGNQLEARLKEIRAVKAHSVIDELRETLALARADLNTATQRLATVEAEVGSDLGELRILNAVGSGESNLRQTLNQIKNELRQATAKKQSKLEQERLLIAAQADPSALLATSSQLFESQPSVRRLKEGLVDAQLRKAELSGKMRADHPAVVAATAAEQEVRDRLHDELGVALRGARSDLALSEAQIASLQKQLAEVQGRLDHLAKLRASYGNLVADVRQRSEIVEKAQQNFSSARASEEAARASSLITRSGDPETGEDPIGPGRAQIVMFCTMGGLFVGMGLMLLITPLQRAKGRRFSDFFPTRRQSDQSRVGRRGEERANGAARPASNDPFTAPGGNDPKRRNDDWSQQQRAETLQRGTAMQRATDRPTPNEALTQVDPPKSERRQGDRRQS